MKLKTFFSLTVFFLYAFVGYAQLHVDEDEDVGVGTENTGEAKLNVLNNSNRYSLIISNGYSGSSEKYGINNYIGSSGSGVKYGLLNRVLHNASSSSTVTGIRNNTTGFGVGDHYGYHGILDQDGDSKKYGLYTVSKQNSLSAKSLYGEYHTLVNNGTGESTGSYCVITSEGTGTKTGYYSKVIQNANSNNTIIGFTSYTYPASNLNTATYGIYNNVSPSANATGDKFGVRHVIDTLGSGTRYGVYSDIKGGPGYAGYFIGDLVYTGQLNPSDEKFKKEIKDVGDCSNIIKKIKPRRYKLKKSELYNGTEKEQFGFVAQELEKILPELVREVIPPTNSNELVEQEGPNGETILVPATNSAPSEPFKAINYNGLIPIMMQGLKEQQVQIEELEKKLGQISKKLEELEKG